MSIFTYQLNIRFCVRILYVPLNGPEKKMSIFTKTLFKMNFFENAVFELTGGHLKKDDACENSCVGWGGKTYGECKCGE